MNTRHLARFVLRREKQVLVNMLSGEPFEGAVLLRWSLYKTETLYAGEYWS